MDFWSCFSTTTATAYSSTLRDSAPLIDNSNRNTFAFYTLHERLPRLIDNIIEQEGFDELTNKKLQDLVVQVQSGDKISALDDEEDDVYFLSERSGRYMSHLKEWFDFTENWASGSFVWQDMSPAIVSEMYFYRTIASRTGYFTENSRNFLVDPYRVQKQRAMEESESFVLSVAKYLGSAGGVWDEAEKESVFQLLAKLSLWGNQADLKSYKSI
eukprot:TRINITY_DN3979_c0_g1_i1.p1 TRINITY_DN3979_c0_g1~~TRINITY_DN3979_c0_g1_i1.p1  ORF type:complete len:214 (-),score=36.38 TRINITY_DN3979_c0_g1_i1:416-1057(-)